MNTTAVLLGSLCSERARLSSARERRYGDRHHYYVLATESPRHSDDDESILSIQAKETDYVQDTSDTESYCDSLGELEPISDAPSDPLSHSDESEEEIITTRVISVESARTDELDADSEGSAGASDAELGPHDYWRCARCHSPNNNPLYRYCHRCYQVRKNLFPPRPKRRSRPLVKLEPVLELSEPLGRACPERPPRPSLPSLASYTDSGIDSAHNSQELHPDTQNSELPRVPFLRELCSRLLPDPCDSDSTRSARESRARKRRLGRRSGDDGDSPAGKRRTRATEMPTGAVVRCLRRQVAEADEALCVVCCAEPKSGVFVHGRIAHICCCYRCAVRVWSEARRCPVCNCRVSNVLKAVVM